MSELYAACARSQKGREFYVPRLPTTSGLPGTGLCAVGALERRLETEVSEAVQAAVTFVESEPRTEEKRQEIMTQLRTASDYLSAIFRESKRPNRYYASRYVNSIREMVRRCNLIGVDKHDLASKIGADWANIQRLLLPETSVNAGWFFPESSGKVPEADSLESPTRTMPR